MSQYSLLHSWDLFILLILAFNAVIFIVVIAVIIKHTIQRSSGHMKRTDSIQIMTNIISVFFLFGLTSSFGALTIMKAATTFQIVFTILSSFQGFLIFIFFCVLQERNSIIIGTDLPRQNESVAGCGIGIVSGWFVVGCLVLFCGFEVCVVVLSFGDSGLSLGNILWFGLRCLVFLVFLSLFILSISHLL